MQVIAYIASNFRKDKIWMRRTRPDKRRYQVPRSTIAQLLDLQMLDLRISHSRSFKNCTVMVKDWLQKPHTGYASH